MRDFLSHILDWLTTAPALSGAEWLLLLPLLGSAAIIFNSVTGTSDPARMISNFLCVVAGSVLGLMLFPDLTPVIDPAANFTLALFSGMTGMVLISYALFRSS